MHCAPAWPKCPTWQCPRSPECRKLAPDDGGVTRQRRLLWLLPAPNAIAVAALQRLRRGPSCHSVTPLATSAKLGLGLGCIATPARSKWCPLWQCRQDLGARASCTLAVPSHLGTAVPPWLLSRLPRLLKARLTADLWLVRRSQGRDRPTGRPATASRARASRLPSRPLPRLGPSSW